MDTETKKILIRDSIIGSSYYLPAKVLLYPLIDNLLIMHQSQLVFAIWEDDTFLFSTLKDSAYTKEYNLRWKANKNERISLGETRYSLSIHDFSSFEEENGEVCLRVAHDETKLTAELLNKQDIDLLDNKFFQALEESITDQNEFLKLKHTENTKQDYSKVTNEEAQRLLKPVRNLLDDVFSIDFPMKYLNTKYEEIKYKNVFAIVRYCPDNYLRFKNSFDYTARMILLSETKEAIKKILVKNDCTEQLSKYSYEEFIQKLETPLGPDSRSVADLVFSSGNVNFGHKAHEKDWDTFSNDDSRQNSSDTERRKLEGYIYPEDSSLFYHPIHIGGTPWLCLFTFNSDTNEESGWHHNYSFYRDMASKVARTLREEIPKIYSDLIADILIKNINDSVLSLHRILPKINRELQKLARIYPFSLLEIKEDENDNGDNILDIHGRGRAYIKFHDNPFFKAQVDYKLTDNESIVKKCQTALGDFRNLEKIFEINAFAQSSHLLKTPLNVLQGLIKRYATAENDSINLQIKKILELHQIPPALISQDKHRSFREKHKKLCRPADFISHINQQINLTLKHLSTPGVSDQVAYRLEKINKANGISKNLSLPDEEEGIQIAYYTPQVFALLDGLLTNALKYYDETKNINIELQSDEQKKYIYLIVSNGIVLNTKINLRIFNDPPPDKLGITELHWICKVCWDEKTPKSISWHRADNTLTAKALIGRYE